VRASRSGVAHLVANGGREALGLVKRLLGARSPPLGLPEGFVELPNDAAHLSPLAAEELVEAVQVHYPLQLARGRGKHVLRNGVRYVRALSPREAPPPLQRAPCCRGRRYAG